jgi:capsid protein
MNSAEYLKQMEQKRGELAAVFAKHKNDKGEYDMPVNVLEEINSRNSELTELGKKYDLARMEEKNAQELEGYNKPAPSVPHAAVKSEAPKNESKSVGEMFVESVAFKGYSGGRSPVAMLDIDVKTLMETGAGWAPENLRTGRVELKPERQPRVVDLLPKFSTNMAAIKYMEETTFTNNAVEKAEGAAAGEAALALTERTSNVRKIPVLLPVTDEQMEDVEGIRDYINNRLKLMLEQRLDLQIVKAFLWNPKSFNLNPDSPTQDPNHPDFIGFAKPLILNDPMIYGQQSVNWVARRLYEQACVHKKWVQFMAPLALVTDATDTKQTKPRPLRVYDTITFENEKAIITNVNMAYNRDSVQFAHYQALMQTTTPGP